MQTLDQFAKRKYMNLETFRRSGIGVKTPVWFVQLDGRFYVKTFAGSGKVKRIRNNSQVNIVPSKVDGTPKGFWLAGKSSLVGDESLEKRVDQLYDRKYGLLKKLFFRSRTRADKGYCLLEIEPVE
jgi:PPOX class probable F420-dependent enzyme